MSDPYRVHGLDRNPFIAEQVPGVAETVWLSRGQPTQITTRPRLFIQVMGDKGAGKTSHLLRWRKAGPGPYVHVPPGWGRAIGLPRGEVVYWDEADRALWLRPALAWQGRIGGCIVVGTHRDLSSEARRAGFTVQTYALGPLRVEEVRTFARLRIEAVGGCAADWRDLPFADVAAAAGASLRQAAHLLHIEVAKRVTRAVAV